MYSGSAQGVVERVINVRYYYYYYYRKTVNLNPHFESDLDGKQNFKTFCATL